MVCVLEFMTIELNQSMSHVIIPILFCMQTLLYISSLCTLYNVHIILTLTDVFWWWYLR